MADNAHRSNSEVIEDLLLSEPVSKVSDITHKDEEEVTEATGSEGAKTNTEPVEPEISNNEDGEEEEEESPHLMYRFTLYETACRFYLVGQDVTERHYRVLKIDRIAEPGQLSVFEDENIYNKTTIHELLTTIDDGNRGSGGLRQKCIAWGLLGFIKFTDIYYMHLITKRHQVAMLGGHYIYQIEATELIPLPAAPTSRLPKDESRYLSIFARIDMSKSFYYSFSYNITQSLQRNMTSVRQAIKSGGSGHSMMEDWNDMFVWNHHMLEPAKQVIKHTRNWCVPVIHGYVQQAALDVVGRQIFITLIGRRSRHFAGARYLKRGANDKGHVANDVETEQIVSDLVTTSFHGPGPKMFSNPKYTAFVQHRGSIPLYWSQDTSKVVPKPPIDLTPVDPFYSAAALHFDNLFERYGAPVYVLNLIKTKERVPRETILLHEFQKALAFLNQSLPTDKKILYRAFDMSRATKTSGQDVIGVLENIAEVIMEHMSFFQNGDYQQFQPSMQNGVARTNCIDCLDRTNAAQFVIGKCALGHQLKALGVISGLEVAYESDAINIFRHMFHAHGDIIALQYSGSQLAHTVSTYSKNIEWKDHYGDMVESVKRYYNNSFLDSQRQESFNLFLGHYTHVQGEPRLWDLDSDYRLHHLDPREFKMRQQRDYINWYTPKYLEPNVLADYQGIDPRKYQASKISDEYWLEYYRPSTMTSFGKTLGFRKSSRSYHLTLESHQQNNNTPDSGQSVARKGSNTTKAADAFNEKNNEKGHVRIVEPVYVGDEILGASVIVTTPGPVFANQRQTPLVHSPNIPTQSTDKSQWSLKQWYENITNPSVTEQDEYIKYVEYPQTIPLTTGLEEIDVSSYSDLAAYLQRGEPPELAVAWTPKYEVEAIEASDQNDSAFSDIDAETLADYEDFLKVAQREAPLDVTEEDGGKKRYKAYRQWLKGRSFFKLSKMDPEYEL